MKTFILATLLALTVVLGGCATSGGDLVGTRANDSFPEGSMSLNVPWGE